MVAVKARASGFIPTTFPRRKSYPVRSHKAVLRHAVAKHDPNAGRQDVLLLCDRTYSRITDHDEEKKEKRGESE